MTQPDTAASPTNAPTSQDDFRVLVSRYLGEYVSNQRLAAGAIDDRYDILWQSIEQLVAVGGKRIRPYVVAATYEAFAKQSFPHSFLPVASGQELLHLAMLVHDDVIDRDDVRYGIKNVSGQYVDYYSSHLHDEAEQHHFATSAAILAGDALLSGAHVLTALVPVEAQLMARLQQVVGISVFEVVGGELLDTEATFMPVSDQHSLLVSRYKTASYTFIAPFQIGALLAGASEEQLIDLQRIGEALGIGYQLRDDVLGVFGDSQVTGKSTIGDIREGKRTYLIEQFERLSTPSQRTKFNELFGNEDLTNDELATAKQLLNDSGALTATESAIDHYAQSASSNISTLALDENWSAPLLALADRYLNRNA